MKPRCFYVDPVLYRELQKAAQGDPRTPFRIGETVRLAPNTKGSEEELHLHISFIQRAPEGGGKISFGITVLPFDVRWNRLWTLAQQELPMLKTWLWGLMSRANDQVDEEHFLATQYPDPEEPPPRRRKT